ncbi:conserved hypothetical protein (plasmid) [Borreliella afzelii ACA-1]|nr:conserved hypothetical protein [Borreliella afzelii ACA-1]
MEKKVYEFYNKKLKDEGVINTRCFLYSFLEVFLKIEHML